MAHEEETTFHRGDGIQEIPLRQTASDLDGQAMDESPLLR